MDDNASQIIGTLEEKQLAHLMTAAMDAEDKSGVQVYIGCETSVQSMKDCSVVTVTYELEDGLQGTIGLVGKIRLRLS